MSKEESMSGRLFWCNMNTVCQVLALTDDDMQPMLGYSSQSELETSRNYGWLPDEDVRERIRKYFSFIPDCEYLMNREFSYGEIVSRFRGRDLLDMTYADSLNILRNNISTFLDSFVFLKMKIPFRNISRKRLEGLVHCRKLPSKTILQAISTPLHIWYYKLYLDDLSPYMGAILPRFLQDDDFASLRLYALDIRARIGSESLFDNEESMRDEIKRLRTLLGSVAEYMVLFAGREEPEKSASFKRRKAYWCI